MLANMKSITFEEFLKIRKELYDNAEELLLKEDSFHQNIVTRLEWQYQHFDQLYLSEPPVQNRSDFRNCYHFERTMARWNLSAYGKNYQNNLKKYKKLSEDPASVKKLKRMVECCTFSWVRAWRDTKAAVREDRFLSFWKFHIAHGDTKGSWRHWWDALSNDTKFNVGDIVQLRANAKTYHVFEVKNFKAVGEFLRRLDYVSFKGLPQKSMMVIAYDQQSPDHTYSYKKSQGSCRVVSVLPMGSAKILYVPEQFLKICRKKTIKDAKVKR